MDFGDRYVDAVVVGRGAAGVVHRARSVVFSRDVAVKVFHRALPDERTQRAFRRECEMLGVLGDHPNLVPVHDGGLLPDGRPYVVLAWCEHGSVAVGEPLPPEGAAAIGAAVADGLQFAHERGILHRHLTPRNVLRRGAGVGLSDFGIGVLAADDDPLPDPEYTAPEVLAGDRGGSVAADVFGLAATVHALLTGVPPFPRTAGESDAEHLARRTTQPAPALPDAVPPRLAAAVLDALAPDPERRTPSARAFGDALRAAAAAEGLVLALPPVPAGDRAVAPAVPEPVVQAVPLTPTTRPIVLPLPSPAASPVGSPVAGPVGVPGLLPAAPPPVPAAGPAAQSCAQSPARPAAQVPAQPPAQRVGPPATPWPPAPTAFVAPQLAADVSAPARPAGAGGPPRRRRGLLVALATAAVAAVVAAAVLVSTVLSDGSGSALVTPGGASSDPTAPVTVTVTAPVVTTSAPAPTTTGPPTGTSSVTGTPSPATSSPAVPPKVTAPAPDLTRAGRTAQVSVTVRVDRPATFTALRLIVKRSDGTSIGAIVNRDGVTVQKSITLAGSRTIQVPGRYYALVRYSVGGKWVDGPSNGFTIRRFDANGVWLGPVTAQVGAGGKVTLGGRVEVTKRLHFVELQIAVRAPGDVAVDADGNALDVAFHHDTTNVSAGKYIQGTRVYTKGTYRANMAYQLPDGTWHNGPEITFTVK